MLSEEILELLYKIGDSSTAKIILGGYSISYQEMRRQLYGGRWQSKKERKEEYLQYQKQLEIKERQKFYNTLSYLKKNGYIINNKKQSKTIWGLTDKGVEWLKRKRVLREVRLIPLKLNKEEEDFLKIILFDIPEVHKRAREWLRESLKNFGFSMLQKSVWIGKNKIPQEFILKTKELKIFPYIQIFTIKEKGTLNFCK